MQNEVKLDKKAGVINVIDHGIQTKEKLVTTGNAIRNVSKELRSENLPVRILIDVRDMGEQTADSRSEVVNLFKTLDFDKTAAFGANIYIKYVINFILYVLNRSKIKYFETENEAKEWLLKT